jgi:hypothetical protein
MRPQFSIAPGPKSRTFLKNALENIVIIFSNIAADLQN